MKINNRKLYLDFAIKVLIVANLGLFALFSCAKIGERLDAQSAAEERYIQDYQTELKREQNKDTTHERTN